MVASQRGAEVVGDRGNIADHFTRVFEHIGVDVLKDIQARL
ncbi:hypothetical protein SDC9_192118 [bioreactor metagenome]|uniref:Uncharacterized protein n=1 Tax=bioreactor metagenome TaxID=1076179 RepID=A0A645IAU9_9ZZZZ